MTAIAANGMNFITVVTTYWGVGALCTGFALLPLLLLYGGYRLGRGYLRRWNQK